MELLPQVLLLLGVAVAVILVLQRLDIPSTIGYLLVGVILGPGTVGPVVDGTQIEALAEFGIVFLLFTIGLGFSLPQLGALRRKVPILGTGQVVLTTAVVALAAWAVGLAPAAAFVIGAVFAQSSTTIIGKQLAEQGEENSSSGRLGLALSVFQDVTAVPFVVVIPVLGAAVGAGALGGELGLAVAKAALAVLILFVAGHWLLRPLFHLVARLKSAEMFTLTVLFVVLIAAWTTDSLGLSLAFGAFLAGMTLGETEFRHQVEATIRPFRDVLLGLFFVAIGMLFDPAAFPRIWYWALLGAFVLLVTKAVVVAALTRAAGFDRQDAVRTGLLLTVGGEFGLALLAIAFTTGNIDAELSQIGLTSVLVSMLVGTFLIRHNRAIARAALRVAPMGKENDDARSPSPIDEQTGLTDHVVVCGYGRIGQSVAHFLEAEDIPFVAVDLDVARVREARAAHEPVYFGDAGEREVMVGLGVDRARLVVVAHDDTSSALRTLAYIQSSRPDLPVMVRARDESHVAELGAAGAFEVFPDKVEAGLSIASQALLLLDVPVSRVMERVRHQRTTHYPLMREYFRGSGVARAAGADDLRIRAVAIPRDSAAVGCRVEDLTQNGATVAALLRAGERLAAPEPDTELRAEDVVVLHGPLDVLAEIEARILRESGPRRKEAS